MRVLYVLHRYHPNMIATMKGWVEHGDEVRVLSQYEGKIEDHTWVTPTIVGYSKAFQAFWWLWVHVLRRHDPFAKDINLKCGFPPKRKMEKLIVGFQPDLVILRERSLYTMRCYRICRKHGYRAFLFNLSPQWAEPSYFKHDFAHRFVRKRTPEYRLTPSRQIGVDMNGKVMDPHTYFAPFVVDPVCAPSERQYLENGKINILEIGKYQDRKNHFLMVRVVERLVAKYPNIRLTIIGEISDHFHQEYYDKLKQYLAEHRLEDYVTLRYNVPKKEVNESFRHTDLFILPSHGEPASISVIEPMTCSVPVIGSDDNGTADYIEQGVCGAVFHDCDEDDLYRKMDEILTDAPVTIPQMGAAAYENVVKNFSFDAYYCAIEQMIRDQDAEAGRG